MKLKNAASLSPLPWTIADLGDVASLSSWTVLVDGVQRKFHVALRNGKLVLVAQGTMVLVR